MATSSRSAASSCRTDAPALLEREDIREFYLGQKDAGVRGATAVEEEEAVAVNESRSRCGYRGDNIAAMVFAQIERAWCRNDYAQKDRGIWKSTTWSRARQDPRPPQAAMALKAVGYRKVKSPAFSRRTSPAWVITDLGILSAGGISAGIYTTDTPNGSSTHQCMRLPHRVRRQRRASRQGAGGARRLPWRSRDRHLRHEGVARFQRSDGESLQAFLARGERLRRIGPRGRVGKGRSPRSARATGPA